MRLAGGTAELLAGGMFYFDASAWNDLIRHPERDRLIESIRHLPAVVFASVISVGEVVRIRDQALRKDACSIMQGLHGKWPLLEHPLRLAAAAAEAFLRGESDVLLPQTGPARTLYSFMHRPDNADAEAIGAWLENLDVNLERFLLAARPGRPDRLTSYHSPEVLRTEAFQKLLVTIPPAVERGLSVVQVGKLIERVDIWRALAGTLGYIITQAKSHSPKRREGRKRPGGPDIWQAVYLGVIEVFITSDVRQIEAVAEVSLVLRHPRCVVPTSEFLDGVQRRLARAPESLPTCPVCGCALPTKRGVHARRA